MKPTKFKESNVTFTAPGLIPECGDLPAYVNQKQIISCWKASFLERLKILFTGNVWIAIRGKKQPPMWLDGSVPFYRATIADNLRYILAEIGEGFSEEDKQYHMIAGMLITAGILALLTCAINIPLLSATIAALFVGVMAGVVKDLVWDKWLKKGTFDIYDIVFTAFGAIAVAIVVCVAAVMFEWYCKYRLL